MFDAAAKNDFVVLHSLVPGIMLSMNENHPIDRLKTAFHVRFPAKSVDASNLEAAKDEINCQLTEKQKPIMAAITHIAESTNTTPKERYELVVFAVVVANSSQPNKLDLSKVRDYVHTGLKRFKAIPTDPPIEEHHVDFINGWCAN